MVYLSCTIITHVLNQLKMYNGRYFARSFKCTMYNKHNVNIRTPALAFLPDYINTFEMDAMVLYPERHLKAQGNGFKMAALVLGLQTTVLISLPPLLFHALTFTLLPAVFLHHACYIS
eukprot:g82775.t1